MESILDQYHDHADFWHFVIAFLVFAGLARVAFWRDAFGMRIAAPLVIGIGLLLAIALVSWAKESGRRIQDLGPWAAFVLLVAVMLVVTNARRKSRML